MNIPKRLYVAAAVILFVGGAGTALALKPQTQETKDITFRQASAVSEPVKPAVEELQTHSQENVQTPAAPAPTPSQPVAEQEVSDEFIYDENATVVSIELVDVGNGWQDCRINFSDGTSTQRSWKMNYNGTIKIEGICDNSLVGTLKSVN